MRKDEGVSAIEAVPACCVAKEPQIVGFALACRGRERERSEVGQTGSGRLRGSRPQGTPWASRTVERGPWKVCCDRLIDCSEAERSHSVFRPKFHVRVDGSQQ